MNKFKQQAETASKMFAKQALSLCMEHNARLTDRDGFDREALEHTLEFVLLAASETTKLFNQKILEIKKVLESEEEK